MIPHRSTAIDFSCFVMFIWEQSSTTHLVKHGSTFHRTATSLGVYQLPIPMAVTLSSTQCAHYRGLPHHQQCCSAAVRTSGHSTFYTIWTPRGAALLSIQQKERLVKPHVAGATATLANSAPPPPSSNVATAAAAAAVPPVLSSPAINIPEPIPGIVSPPKA